MQQCSKCKKNKNIDQFYSANNKRGTMAACKQCKKIENSKHRNNIITKEQISKVNKIWRINNKQKKQSYDKKWQTENKHHYKTFIKNWEYENKEKLLEYRREYRKKRIENDINFKLACNLRSRLTKVISRNQKTGSAVKDLGCTVEEFRRHLESKFTNGMNWDNYGEWHIDHIKPLASFDLTNPEELKQACHFSNLQPLWAKDNLRKSDKV